jgi:hypothetical protein
LQSNLNWMGAAVRPLTLTRIWASRELRGATRGGVCVCVCSWPPAKQMTFNCDSVESISRLGLACVCIGRTRSQFVDASGIQPAASANARDHPNKLNKKLYHPRSQSTLSSKLALWEKNSPLYWCKSSLAPSVAPQNFIAMTNYAFPLFSFKFSHPKFHRILPQQLYYGSIRCYARRRSNSNIIFEHYISMRNDVLLSFFVTVLFESH